MSVLAELVASARERVARLPPFERELRGAPARPDFAQAVRGRDSLSVIAEFKRRSPSAGGIDETAAIERQLPRYASAGAAAISVLTEPTRFLGGDADLERAAQVVDLPLLMKDFVVDARQVRRARELGASAVLLIARCLDDAALRDLAAACATLGLAALVECHDAAEVDRALAIERAMIGVNNRDLDTLAIDLSLAPRLLARVPGDRVAVAESGYLEPRDAAGLRGLADAVLIGTSLMKSRDPAAFVREVRG